MPRPLFGRLETSERCFVKLPKVAKTRLSSSFLNVNWLVVSTHLKNISQIGNLPQVGVKMKNIWNHQPAFVDNCLLQATKLLTLLQVKPKEKYWHFDIDIAPKCSECFMGFSPTFSKKKGNSPVQKTTWDRFRSTPRKTNMTGWKNNHWMKMYNSLLFFAKH